MKRFVIHIIELFGEGRADPQAGLKREVSGVD
jgi:hypothetical protein